MAVSPAQTRAIAAVNIQDLRKDLYRIQNDPNASDIRKADAETRYREKLAEIAATGASGAVLPIVKKKGEDSVYNRLIQMLEAGAALPCPAPRAAPFTAKARNTPWTWASMKPTWSDPAPWQGPGWTG